VALPGTRPVEALAVLLSRVLSAVLVALRIVLQD
jgi:hypothetical protein